VTGWRPAVPDLTYPEIGATRDASMPPGYHHVDRDEHLGTGAATFERAAAALCGWRMHEAAGMTVVESREDDVVLRWLLLTIPCRVVYTVDEPRRRGFAYGTLPGHPERGEEAFVVGLTDTGEVRFRVRAFSRPASLLARAGGPVGRRVQRYMTDRYVTALRRLSSHEDR
jgi:uncharacterized protein (UPF0548 family)